MQNKLKFSNHNQRTPFPEGEGGRPRFGDRIRALLENLFIADGRGVVFYFVLPSLLGVLIFVLIPFVDVVRRSFATTMGGENIGFANYRTIFHNDAFLLAGGNTIKFMLVCLPLLLCLSLGLALILYAIGEKAGIFKTAFLVPMAVPARGAFSSTLGCPWARRVSLPPWCWDS
ncbi:hypothetical protein U6B65_02240 [Oscillospiraceae bacterium MB08-C2-2]|nr:hypothetical protein U6B65_02240 [Oscillospiraceae bacterium MB08-C2-2]